MIGKRTDLTLTLSVPALDGKEIYVTAVDGRERISDLFRYEIEFTSADTIDPLDAIGQAATLTINAGGNVLTAHGILAEFSAGDATPAGDFAYQTVLAPRLSLLDLSRQNLVYGTADPIKLGDLVDSVLTNGAGTESTSGGHGLDIRHELRLRSDYLARAQVVQYGESDLSFLKRQCEHEGVFFFFEHDDQSEIVVFGDKNDVCKNVDIGGAPTIAFNNKRGSARTGDLAVTRFRATAKPVPGTIHLRDYNETKTSPPLKVTETVTDQGFGNIVEYGQHFDDEDQGKALAKIRAEEIACRRIVYKGESNVPQLRAGTVFTLTDHTLSSKPVQFLVVSVRHSVSVPPPSAFAPLPFGHEARAARPYANEIECVPFETAFRPERKTPRPNVSGLFTAQIDAEENQGERGWMDERGRYKVRFAFDDGKYNAGKASDYVRQSQPYIGPHSSGLHFPLVQGTEVVVGYLNGDPDRPVVVGAVADEKNGDPVTKDNRTLNRIETASNVMLEIDDREAPAEGAAKDAPFFRIDTPAEVGGRSFTGTYLRMGKSVDKDEKTLLPKAIQAAAKAAGTAGKTAPSTDGAMLYTNQDLNVNVDGSATYTYGTGYATETTTGNSAHKVDAGKYTLNTSDNIEMTTAKDINLSAYNMAVTLSGSKTITVDGSELQTVSGSSEGHYVGPRKTNHYSMTQNLMWDDTTWLAMSMAFSMKLSLELAINTGLQTKICIGGEVKFATPQDSKFVAGLNLTYVYGLDFKYVSGATNQIAVSAFKFLTAMDYKNAATDFKHVTLDAKIAESSISKTELEFNNAVVTGKDQKIVSLNNTVETMKSTTSSKFTTLFCVA